MTEDRSVTRDLKITIRVTETEKMKLKRLAGDKPVSTFIRDLVLSPTRSDPSPGFGPAGDVDGLKEDIQFMFDFFQRNASNLILTDDDRIKLKDILNKIRGDDE